MMEILSETAARALAHAAEAAVDEAEAYVAETAATGIKVYGGKVEELTGGSSRGVGIRVFRGSAMGFAYSSDLSREGLAATVKAAVKNAQVTAPDDHAGLPRPAAGYPQGELYDPGVTETPLQEKIELALEVEAKALAYDQRVSQVEQAVYHEAQSKVAVANSLGLEGAYRESSCYLFVQAIAAVGGEMQTGISFSTARNPRDLDAPACGREGASRAVDLLGAVPVESMTCPVVMDPFVTASLVGVVGSVLTGEAVQRQRSLFAGLEGERVASEAFNLVDDGVHPRGLASAPFDGEGVPAGATGLIERGLLTGFLYDERSGRRDGRRSTGNGIRGSYRSIPRTAPSNLRVTGGTATREEIIASVDKGLYVTGVSGVHSGANAVSGDFSVGATGRLIDAGRLSTPVRKVTIAGDILSMLRSVAAVGNDARWVPFGGSIEAPTLLIAEMSVSGR